MHVHEHGPLAGEFNGVGTVEETRHLKPVKAFDGHQFRFDILGYIKTARFTLRPACYFQVFRVNAVGIGGAAGRREGDPDVAPFRNFKAANNAYRQTLHDARSAGFYVENFDLAYPRLVRGIDDEASVRRNVECLDVPLFGRPARRECARLYIHRAKPLEVGALVRSDPQCAIRRKFCAADSDVLLMVANWRHLATRQIKRRHIHVGH